MGEDHGSADHGQDQRGGERRLGWRPCLRKGCARVYHAVRWDQRYCGETGCAAELELWKQAKGKRGGEALDYGVRRCQSEQPGCEALFRAASPNQSFCESCRRVRKREQAAARQRQRRLAAGQAPGRRSRAVRRSGLNTPRKRRVDEGCVEIRPFRTTR